MHRIYFVINLLFCFVWVKASAQPMQSPLKDSIDLFMKAGRYAEVVPLAERWVVEVKKSGEESAAYGAGLTLLGRAVNRAGKPEEGKAILKKSLEIKKKILGEVNPEVALSWNELASCYLRQGKLDTAKTYYQKALDIRQKTLDSLHPDVAMSHTNLGIVAWQSGDFEKAEQLYLRALAIRKKSMNENDPDMARSYLDLGSFYLSLNEFKKAEPYMQKGLEMKMRIQGPEHPDVGEAYGNLAIMYHYQGKYAQAEAAYLHRLELARKNKGENGDDLGAIYNNLGVFYQNKGLYAKSETYYLKGLELRKKALGDDHPEVASSYGNLGVLSDLMGNFPRAEHWYQAALAIQQKALPENHPDLGSTYLNLGTLYNSAGNYPKAEKHAVKALEIHQRSLGEDNPDLGYAYTCLGGIFFKQGKLTKASNYFHKGLLSWKNGLGSQHPNLAISWQQLGELGFIQGKKQQAEIQWKKALDMRRKILGADHPETGNSLNQLGRLYFETGKTQAARQFLFAANDNRLRQLQQYFPALSDDEKGRFFQSLEPDFDLFRSMCFQKAQTMPTFLDEQYNTTLITKALLLNTLTRWKQRIKTSGDSNLIALYARWEEKQDQISRLYSETDSVAYAGLDSIVDQSEKIEKELSARAEAYGKPLDPKRYTWKDIQAGLKPGEAAIEMVRFRKYGVERTLTETVGKKKLTYRVKGLTDTIHYAAMLVKPGLLHPELILLPNGNELETKGLSYYKNCIRNQTPDARSYNEFWKKIGDRLGPAVERVYFSPDGVFHSINLNTLFSPDTKKYLLEEKDIRVVTVTRDLIQLASPENENRLAYLFGFPNFEAPFEQRQERNALPNPRAVSQEYSLEDLDAKKIVVVDLPGTKVEVERISDILGQNGWEVRAFTRDNALEESMKESFKPKLMHIATHGYFEKDSGKIRNPLLRSGLLLSGAGQTLNGKKSMASEDGILTAYEAMNLNLDNTDLVVLSACETGLGEIKNGEGVYGLQRAFKVAGAKSIIMSLWKVDDEATQELMVSFYRHWLGSTVGAERQTADAKAVWPKAPTATASKRSSFLAAQKELKAKYPNPYYWGAFVMVGE